MSVVDLGQFRSRTCGGMSRRAFLRVGASIPLALGVGGTVSPASAAMRDSASANVARGVTSNCASQANSSALNGAGVNPGSSTTA